jgi:hypothetical protein
MFNRPFIDDAPRMRNCFRPGRGILARRILAKGKILPRPLQFADGGRERKAK